MIFAASIFQRLADGRVSANLLTFYGLIVLVILAGPPRFAGSRAKSINKPKGISLDPERRPGGGAATAISSEFAFSGDFDCFGAGRNCLSLGRPGRSPRCQ